MLPTPEPCFLTPLTFSQRRQPPLPTQVYHPRLSALFEPLERLETRYHREADGVQRAASAKVGAGVEREANGKAVVQIDEEAQGEEQDDDDEPAEQPQNPKTQNRGECEGEARTDGRRTTCLCDRNVRKCQRG